MNTDSPMPRGVRLAVCGLSKSCHGHAVLKSIDFEVNPGEIFFIIGPSGSGKSILLRHLIGLEKPDQGEVLIEGRAIRPLGTPCRHRVAMVLQGGALLDTLTVGENLGLYLAEQRLKTPAEIVAIVARELARAGLAGAENRMPRELSGGMVKRVAIARALAAEPHLILCDEPTSDLDPISSMNIAEDIVALNQRLHTTTLVVSRDRDLTFGIAHRIAMLDEGRLVAVGTPDELKRHPHPRVQQYLHAGIGRRPAVSARLPTPAPWPEPVFL